MLNATKNLRLILIAIAVHLLATAQGALATPNTASGTFSSGETILSVTDAFAYRGPSGYNQKPSLHVALSNAGFGEETAHYYDRQAIIQEVFGSGDSGVVFLELDLTGEFRAFSFSWSSGKGCGYCGQAEYESTLALKNGRITGSVKGHFQDMAFDLKLDAAIARDNRDDEISTSKGPVVAAYRRFEAALADGKNAQLQKALSENLRTGLAQARNAGDENGWLKYWRRNQPEDIHIVRAFADDTVANLLLEGRRQSIAVNAEVVLLKENGENWVVDDVFVTLGDY